MSTQSLAILIFFAVLGVVLLPVCMIYCRRCALLAIRNIGVDDDDDDDGQNVSYLHRTHSENINDEEGNARARIVERDRRKREKQILERVVIKVRVDFLFSPFMMGDLILLHSLCLNV